MENMYIDQGNFANQDPRGMESFQKISTLDPAILLLLSDLILQAFWTHCTLPTP